MKIRYKISLFIIAFLALIFLLMYIYRMNRVPTEVVNESKILLEIKDYGYKINDNESDYYKDTFKELVDLLGTPEFDMNIYRDLIAKLFVIDLYSLGTKINKYEVTSMQYFYPIKQEMHRNKVIDNFYNLMEDNSYGKRDQELPIVKEVNIMGTEDLSYTINEVELPAVKISLSIDYEKDLGYDTKGEVTLALENNRWYVVSYNGYLE